MVDSALSASPRGSPTLLRSSPNPPAPAARALLRMLSDSDMSRCQTPETRTVTARSQLDVAGAAGREADVLARQREDDLAAVGLMADHDDRVPRAAVTARRSSTPAPGARRLSTWSVTPAASAIGVAVSTGAEQRAREHDARPLGREARRQLLRGRATGRGQRTLRVRVSGAASAWRTRMTRTAVKRRQARSRRPPDVSLASARGARCDRRRLRAERPRRRDRARAGRCARARARGRGAGRRRRCARRS